MINRMHDNDEYDDVVGMMMIIIMNIKNLMNANIMMITMMMNMMLLLWMHSQQCDNVM